ncbi:hypothetical protein LC065_12625 [Halobacillus litoralis]|nr:hypothetical protein [Halobacillus litoralis]WLR46422.1 hypothetical protein LC065_12625 [Halobacillus litoralis]
MSFFTGVYQINVRVKEIKKARDLDGNLLEAYLPGLYEEDWFKPYR